LSFQNHVLQVSRVSILKRTEHEVSARKMFCLVRMLNNEHQMLWFGTNFQRSCTINSPWYSLSVIEERVHFDSTIVSCSWHAYNAKQNAGFYSPQIITTTLYSDAHTQIMQVMWHSAKRSN
jgi:hypothetical protein